MVLGGLDIYLIANFHIFIFLLCMCDVYLCLNSERFKNYAAAAFIFPESTQLYIYIFERNIYIPLCCCFYLPRIHIDIYG